MKYKTFPPICIGCKYFRGSKHGMCDAYPKEIPEEIWSGAFVHEKPFPGDRGYRFRPKESEFLSVGELARLLNVAHKTIYRALWTKKIPAYKIGRMWRVSRKDLEFTNR